MSLALGPIIRFMTQASYALLLSRQAWCDMLPITSEGREELKFWSPESIEEYHAQPIWQSPSAVRCVYSDASDVGCGGYAVEHGMHVAQGTWSAEEAKQSSTWRELVAVGRVLESVAGRLDSTRVCWFTFGSTRVCWFTFGSTRVCWFGSTRVCWFGSTSVLVW